jgi:hypothetical protein
MAENESVSGIGLRHVRVMLRDDDGAILVPVTQDEDTGYNGLRVEGANALTVTLADVVRQPVTGDDRVYYTWILPPTETASGELRVSKGAGPVIAMVTGTLQWGSVNRRKIGFGTNKQGEEPNLIVWGCRQTIEADESLTSFGQKRWETYVLLSALAAVKPSTMEYQTVSEYVYSLVANESTVDELGRPFTTALNGFTKAQFVRIVTDEKFMLDAFVAAGDTSFVLSQIPYESGIFEVTVDGVLSHAWTRSGSTITFDSPPATSSKIVVEYEYEAD